MEQSFALEKFTEQDYAALTGRLAQLADEDYRAFHAKLVPGIGGFYGVRVPALRALAKQIAKGDAAGFLALVTDDSYEERILRGLVTGAAFWPQEEGLRRIEAFVPHIDNWAVCDVCTGSFSLLRRCPAEGFAMAKRFLASAECYDKRFALVAMLDFYLTDEYIDEVLALICAVEHENYYVKMAAAWALSVCFVKYRDKTLAALPTVTDTFTYNKALQKCKESFRVSEQDKVLLQSRKRPTA